MYYITHHFRIQKGVKKMKVNELGRQKSERLIFLGACQARTVRQAQHGKETTLDSSQVSATGTSFFPACCTLPQVSRHVNFRDLIKC